MRLLFYLSDHKPFLPVSTIYILGFRNFLRWWRISRSTFNHSLTTNIWFTKDQLSSLVSIAYGPFLFIHSFFHPLHSLLFPPSSFTPSILFIIMFQLYPIPSMKFHCVDEFLRIERPRSSILARENLFKSLSNYFPLHFSVVGFVDNIFQVKFLARVCFVLNPL